jgi:hypothetical protein
MQLACPHDKNDELLEKEISTAEPANCSARLLVYRSRR